MRAFVDGAGGLEVAGYCRTNHWTGSFANSDGQRLTGEAAECGVSGIARDRGADGVARHAPASFVELDGRALGARAAAKARAWTDPVELPPGRYAVVLEPTAVVDIVETLAAAGFNGRAVNERRSFVRLGDAQFDPAITLIDDPVAAGFGYDGEGTPRGRRGARRCRHDHRHHPRPPLGRRGRGRHPRGTRSRAASPGGRWPGTPRCCSSSGEDDDAWAAEVDGPAADSSVDALVAVSSGASSCPTSGTPGCSTRAPWRSPG